MRFTGVVVAYTDVEGRRQSVGPPGTHARIIDDALGEVTAGPGGLPCCAWMRLDQIATEAVAIQIGATWLAEQKATA